MGPISDNSRFVRTSRRFALAGIAVATLSTLMSGCNRTYISKESLSKIRSIEIDTHVAVPEAPYVDGPLTITEFLLGNYPANIGHSFGVYMDAHDIKTDQIVSRAFRRQLMEQGRFELRENGDATLKLEVGRYGFRYTMPSVWDQRKADLSIEATLMSKDSTVMWKQQDATILHPSFTTELSIHTLLGDSQFVEMSLGEASCVLAYLLLSKLHPMPRPPDLFSVESRDESRDVMIGISTCDPVSDPSWTPRKRQIECIPDVGCRYE